MQTESLRFECSKESLLSCSPNAKEYTANCYGCSIVVHHLMILEIIVSLSVLYTAAIGKRDKESL